MKNMRVCVLFSLVVLLMAAVGGCSIFSSSKSAKKTEVKAVEPVSPIEWKERKWENYAEDKGGNVYHFERDTLTFPAKGIIHVWRKRQLAGSAQGLKEITSFDEIDCKTEKFRTLELQGLDSKDTLTAIFKKPSPWTPIFQGSADDYFIIKFCRDATKVNNPPKN